jgi:hypothetical protein
MKLSRRTFTLLAGASALSGPPAARRAAAQQASDARYLFVIAAYGGASIIDSFLPVTASESKNAATLTTYADTLVQKPNGSNLRCVAPLVDEVRTNPQLSQTPFGITQADFLARHGSDTAVMTVEHSSVSHASAQERSMNGGGAQNRGRTILETAAGAYGAGRALPVVNMSVGGYSRPGRDTSYPVDLRQVEVQDARTFSIGMHGYQALRRPVESDLVARARAARQRAEAASAFATRFANTKSWTEFEQLRQRAGTVESSGLLEKLLLSDIDGVSASQAALRARSYLPSMTLDVFEASAALAFLLAFHGASYSVAIGPNNAVTRELADGQPLTRVYPVNGFDNAHQSHRVAQSLCWSRTLKVGDGLIRLLKETEDPRHVGEALWARSLVYFATEFGREKVRPNGALDFGTGHDLNNGVVMVSPLLRGNRVYGGVDPNTCHTYGFDPVTGAPAPGTTMKEEHVYGVIAQALGVDFPGRNSVPCMVKG